MRRFPCLRVLAFTALFVAVGCMVTEAQQQRGGPRDKGGRQRGPGMRGPAGGSPGRGGVVGLLRIEKVQEEVGITEDQKAEITEIIREQAAEMRERFVGLKRENREEMSEAQRQAERERMGKEFQDLAKSIEGKIRGILQPEQFKRLKQIELQQLGVAAMRRPDMVQALGLTEEQTQELRELFEDAQTQREEIHQQARALFQGFRDASEEERAGLRAKGEQLRARGDNLQKEAQEKAMGLLTDDQKDKLKSLMGEPFKLDKHSMKGRAGGRRPGGGRDGQGDGKRRPQEERRPASTDS